MSGTSTPDIPKVDPSAKPESEDARPAGRLTVYSSRSEIRSPITLIKDIFTGFAEGRGIAWRLFLRNLRGMYRQTLLGLFWAFLPPIANTAMWVFLKNQNVFEIENTAVDSTVYILAGMILWQAFIDAFQMPMNKMRSNKNMLSRIRFPRESLLLVGIGEVLFNLAIRLILLVPAFLLYDVAVPSTVFLALPVIAGLVLIGFGLGLIIMPVGSLYQDVGRFLTMAIPFWMIVTPIIYVPPTEYPGTLLIWLNPASPLLVLSRDLLLVGTSSVWQAGMVFGLAALPITFLGLMVYRISLPVLIERMQA